MNRLQKCEIAFSKGITYDKKTGSVIGVRGGIYQNKDKDGYIYFGFRYKGKYYKLLAHHYAYYFVNKKTVPYIDHINRLRDDNRIENLRSVTISENGFNKKNVKGYYYCSNRKQYTSEIVLNGSRIFLGRFDKEKDARNAYLQAKKKYHVYASEN